MYIAVVLYILSGFLLYFGIGNIIRYALTILVAEMRKTNMSADFFLPVIITVAGLLLLMVATAFLVVALI